VWSCVVDLVEGAEGSASKISAEGWDLSRLASFDYFQRIGCDLPLLPLLINVAKSCSGCVFTEQIAYMCERPHTIKKDEFKRFHNETGPALAYDDWSLWAWRGVQVPRFVVETPHEITTEKVLKESNQEVRRVMLERFGYDKLLTELGATTLDTSKWGTLLSTDKLKTYLEGEDEEARFVLVTDPSTSRRYALRVDPSCTTAHAAVAWTFGKTAETYLPQQET
jgi:hypothetical protein